PQGIAQVLQREVDTGRHATTDVQSSRAVGLPQCLATQEHAFFGQLIRYDEELVALEIGSAEECLVHHVGVRLDAKMESAKKQGMRTRREIDRRYVPVGHEISDCERAGRKM